MRLFTIGFTKTSAEHFFGRLQRAGVVRLIDVRLNNVSQLAGFAKRDDLAYFLHTLCGIAYEHRPELAPTKEILDDYKKRRTSWKTYEQQFLQLLAQRNIEDTLPRALLDEACLLCSEHTADHCHRRLVVEHLRHTWRDLDVVHL